MLNVTNDKEITMVEYEAASTAVSMRPEDQPKDSHVISSWMRVTSRQFQIRSRFLSPHIDMGKGVEEPSPSVCPIDPAARTVWLEKAKQARENESVSVQNAPSSSTALTTPIPIPQQLKTVKTRPLALDREISSIPRADPSIATTTPNPSSPKPANNEQETGADVKSGNWIYPSEKMFFNAMKRKSYNPRATDMSAIVPIHNAVNEKAWAEIKDWESRFHWSREENRNCGGPRLHSFSGDSKKLSPRARWNLLLGYQEPFDRHDWVVERCPGQGKVEYVIDFYAGRDEGTGKGLNFYLDVRPKLNSWEGWKMRAGRLIGL